MNVHIKVSSIPSLAVVSGVVLVAMLASCGEDSSSSELPKATPDASAAVTQSPSALSETAQSPRGATEPEILAFLQSGAWKKWTPESAIRPATRAHGSFVQTFLNTKLLGSLQAASTTHPVGSVAVKVLYEADSKTVRGYALEMKTADAASKDDWVWYEGFTPDFRQSYYGRGLTTCTGCHSSGTDYVRAKAPAPAQAPVASAMD